MISYLIRLFKYAQPNLKFPEKKGKVIYDTKRKQLSFGKVVTRITNRASKQRISQILNSVTDIATNFLKSKFGEEYILSEGNILMSEPSKDNQAWHVDFSTCTKFKHRPKV